METFNYELRDSGRITTEIRIEGEGMLAIHTACANRRTNIGVAAMWQEGNNSLISKNCSAAKSKLVSWRPLAVGETPGKCRKIKGYYILFLKDIYIKV